MTSDEPALLAAILANRDDDTSRLAYADWLEENEQGERAEFIRVQCGIARGCCGPSCYGPSGMPCEGIRARMECSGCAELRRRERELRLNHAQKVLPKLPEKWYWGTGSISQIAETGRLTFNPMTPTIHGDGLEGAWVADVTRGFLSGVECSWGGWHRNADAILRAQPIERIKFIDRPIPGELLELRPARDGHKIATAKIAGRVVGVTIPLGEDSRLALVKARWPRIEFELPPANDGQNYAAATAAMQQFQESIAAIGTSLIPVVSTAARAFQEYQTALRGALDANMPRDLIERIAALDQNPTQEELT